MHRRPPLPRSCMSFSAFRPGTSVGSSCPSLWVALLVVAFFAISVLLRPQVNYLQYQLTATQ